MTADMMLILGILAAIMPLLVFEWVPLEVLALLVLGAVAVSGVVSPTEALAGFSNPAVVTIWRCLFSAAG